ADFVSVQNFVNNLPNYEGPEQSIQQAAGVSSRAQALLNAEAANFYGSNSDKIGTKLLSTDLRSRTHNGKSIVLKANPMQDFLLSRFSKAGSVVQLEKAITSINYTGDVVILKDKAGNEYQANKVIVTVPLSVLKTGGISFNPGLPAENTSALQKFGMDPSFRAVIDFKKNFWGEDAGYIWGGTVAPQYLNTGVGRSILYRTLSFTMNGRSAASLSAMSRDQQLTAILSELDGIYAGLATKFVRKTIVKDADGNDTEGPIIAAIKDWTKEEFIKGGSSYPLVGTSATDRENLGKPINGKIFFAGEATDVSGDAGTINGALASAERVAREVIESITQVS
ncbi:MAG TPA: NAD(P)/FAD-dependent oxidoreductase, partial [Cyclobacteriaceae bacterium]